MKLEIVKLEKLAHSNHTAESVFLSLAGRERIRSYTDLKRFRFNLMKQGVKIVDGDFYSLFRQLQELGVGTVVASRKNKPSKFLWNYSLVDVAQAAIEGKAIEMKQVTQPIKKEKRILKVLSKPAENPSSPAAANMALFIPLRTNIAVEMVLPTNISREEIDTVCTAIKRAVRSA